MAADLIRCPGCGVNMDLSVFPVRPEQVVCPRCHTRSAVPPRYYAPYGVQDPRLASNPASMQSVRFQQPVFDQQNFSAIEAEGVSQFYHDDLLSASQLFVSEPRRTSNEDFQYSPNLNDHAGYQGNNGVTYQANGYPQQFQDQMPPQVDPRYYQGYQQIPQQYMQSTPAQYGQAYYGYPSTQFVQNQYAPYQDTAYQTDYRQSALSQYDVNQSSLGSPVSHQQDTNQLDQTFYAEDATEAEDEYSAAQESQSRDDSAQVNDQQLDFVRIQEPQEVQDQFSVQVANDSTSAALEGDDADTEITNIDTDDALEEEVSDTVVEVDTFFDEESVEAELVESEPVESELVESDSDSSATQDLTMHEDDIVDATEEPDFDQDVDESSTKLEVAESSFLEDDEIESSVLEEEISDDLTGEIVISDNVSSDELLDNETLSDTFEFVHDNDQVSFEGKEATVEIAPASRKEEKGLLLPIDKKGNVEPLAFALIGFLSTILLIPFIGIFLCAISLAMISKEKKCNLYNAYRTPARVIAVLGLIVNIIILALEIAIMTSIIVAPSFLVALLY